MSPKRRIWTAVLLAFALWPLGQIWLVQKYDVSPWKFFGWGMYAEPKERPRVQVMETRGGQVIAWDEAKFPGPLVSAIRYFEVRRFALGRLAAPEVLADQVLTAMPGWEGVTILISRKTLDRKTALIRTQLETHAFLRN